MATAARERVEFSNELMLLLRLCACEGVSFFFFRGGLFSVFCFQGRWRDGLQGNGEGGVGGWGVGGGGRGTYMFSLTHTRAATLHTHKYILVCAHAYAHTYVHKYTGAHTCIHTHRSTHTHYINTQEHIDTYTHTGAHTHKYT